MSSFSSNNLYSSYSPQNLPENVRKILSAQIQKIQVVVRKRPLNVREESKGEKDVIDIKGGKSVVIHEMKVGVDLRRYIEDKEFIFDTAYGENISNQEIYINSVRPLIFSAFYFKTKVTCFAYGQTGSGKTHTVLGNSLSMNNNNIPDPGLYILSAYDIYNILSEDTQFSYFSIYISFYEIYCDKLFDLLNGRNRVEPREDANKEIHIIGLTEKKVKNLEELMESISFGLKQRTVGKTGANSDSSRSHGIIQIRVINEKDEEHAKITFIDLAGSEREADKINVGKKTRIDGAEINKSLLALKECIRALDQERSHTPFRGSKLTLVLRDSFIGNCKTLMIANVAPGSASADHTINTLRYADRVKEIRRETGKKEKKNSNTNFGGLQSGTDKKKIDGKKSGKKDGNINIQNIGLVIGNLMKENDPFKKNNKGDIGSICNNLLNDKEYCNNNINNNKCYIENNDDFNANKTNISSNFNSIKRNYNEQNNNTSNAIEINTNKYSRESSSNSSKKITKKNSNKKAYERSRNSSEIKENNIRKIQNSNKGNKFNKSPSQNNNNLERYKNIEKAIKTVSSKFNKSPENEIKTKDNNNMGIIIDNNIENKENTNNNIINLLSNSNRSVHYSKIKIPCPNPFKINENICEKNNEKENILKENIEKDELMNQEDALLIAKNSLTNSIISQDDKCKSSQQKHFAFMCESLKDQMSLFENYQTEKIGVADFIEKMDEILGGQIRSVLETQKTFNHFKQLLINHNQINDKICQIKSFNKSTEKKKDNIDYNQNQCDN